METDMTREEAIKEIKSWDFLNKKETEAIETLIPELRESEDERIRKELLAVINDLILPDEQKARFNAWLEKKKDLDKMIVVSPEVWDTAIADAYENGKKDNEKQKETLHISETCKENTDSFTDEDERIREAIEGAIRVYGKTQGAYIGGYDMDTLVVYLREAFSSLKKQKESVEERLVYLCP